MPATRRVGAGGGGGVQRVATGPREVQREPRQRGPRAWPPSFIGVVPAAYNLSGSRTWHPESLFTTSLHCLGALGSFSLTGTGDSPSLKPRL